MKILVVGPGPDRSKGGMAAVIKGIQDDNVLNGQFKIDVFDSYIDGSKVKRGIYTIFAFQAFKRLYQPYDAFHIHMASYGSAFRKVRYINFLKRRNKKVILHIHGAAFKDFYENLRGRRKAYIAGAIGRCDQVIALSDGWKQYFDKTFGLKNCISIPNGIDVEEFAVCADGENCNDTFLFMGRLGRRKGAYDLVQAVEILSQKHPQVRLYMAGDGEIAQVRELVKKKELEKNIQVVGWVDAEGKRKLLSQAATIILPSYNEGLPMAILEGMAAGKAVISSSVGAIPEVVEEENGILIQPGDVAALAAAMERCMENRGMLTFMGRENRKKIDQIFSRKKMHEALAVCYRQVME